MSNANKGRMQRKGCKRVEEEGEEPSEDDLEGFLMDQKDVEKRKGAREMMANRNDLLG